MNTASHTHSDSPTNYRLWLIAACLAVILVLVWRDRAATNNAPPAGDKPVRITSTTVTQQTVPVRLTANGTVSSQQTVDVRSQISARVETIHIREGQSVQKGDRLFTLDARTEHANLNRTQAQLARSRIDLLNAERHLERQRELFRQQFISQAALDTAQSQTDGLRSQLASDQAALRATQVTRSFTEITAPISGRTGVIPVSPGSLVQPGNSMAIAGNPAQSSAVLVSITQIDPVNVSFTIPEHDLPAIQQAWARGPVPVSIESAPGQPAQTGKLVFIDNAIDMSSGTIRLKAAFPNPDNRLWPGMFVTVVLVPHMLTDALTVPVQAVQNGPEQKFLYTIGEDNKVTPLPVRVLLVQDGIAVIEGARPGIRVVAESGQNLRPGSTIVENSTVSQGTDGAAVKHQRR